MIKGLSAALLAGKPLLGLLEQDRSLPIEYPSSLRPLQKDEPTQRLAELLSDVRNADGYRYNVRDNLGIGMDAVKIIQNPAGGYLAVYHHTIRGTHQTRLATSRDLLHWNFKTNLEQSSSQATITEIPM